MMARRGTWKPGAPAEVDRGELLAKTELAELDDDALVQLIRERSSIDDEARAREALSIIRDEIPENTNF